MVTVRRSKTNQEGETRDVRFVKDGVLRAIRTLWAATSLEPGDRVVPLSAQMIGWRFTAAAAAAGIERRAETLTSVPRYCRPAGWSGCFRPEPYRRGASRLTGLDPHPGTGGC